MMLSNKRELYWPCRKKTWPRDYKTFFMFNSAEHELSMFIKTKMLKIKTFHAFKPSYVVFIMLINVYMPTVVGILTFMSMINFILT